MNVSQLMSKPAVTCSPDDVLSRAAQLMWDNDCGALPVVDERGRLVGIVTDRDICMAAYTQGGALNAIPVGSAMAKHVFTVREEEPLRVIEKLMSTHQVRRIPVVDRDHRPVGVLSLADIARYAVSCHWPDHLGRRVAEMLAAIGQPRKPGERPVKAARPREPATA